MLLDLVTKARSCRRFDRSLKLNRATLEELVNLGRLAACGRNQQNLRYFISTDDAANAAIFPALGWAGYLADWPGPAEAERPTGYIIVLSHQSSDQVFAAVDAGLAMQNILLGAAEKELGACIITSIKRQPLQTALALDEAWHILYVIALGKPGEKVVIEPLQAGGDIKYWRDADGVHHVPKRSLQDIIIN